MLGITGRRVLLSVHIVLNAIWVGGLAAVLFLNLSSGNIETGDQLYGTRVALFRIHDVVVMNTGFGVIVTALLFSLFTKWGFFDFYWVICKWLGLVLMFVIITFVLAPAVNGMAALADVGGMTALEQPAYKQFHRETTIYASILLVMLAGVIMVSVFKPWGPRKKPFMTSRRVVLLSGSVLGLLALAAALLQSMQLQAYRNMPVTDVELASIYDGTYVGTASLGFVYKVEVTVKDHRIEQINVLENYGSVYARLAEGITTKVLRAQSLNVRAVTGATTTSKALLKSMENALGAK